jgi:hypothetical protein
VVSQAANLFNMDPKLSALLFYLRILSSSVDRNEPKVAQPTSESSTVLDAVCPHFGREAFQTIGFVRSSG